MNTVRVLHTWKLDKSLDPTDVFARVVPLLAQIQVHGSLARVCEVSGISYRHAWSLIQLGGDLFNAPLIEMTRGKGAKLTALGEKLVWAETRAQARLAPILDGLSSEISREIASVLKPLQNNLSFHASHCFAVELLCQQLRDSGLNVSIDYCGSQESLKALINDQCDMAGFHVAIDPSMTAPPNLTDMGLDPEAHMALVLCDRQQGLMVQAGNPKKLYRLTDLKQRQTRFIQRQPGSGTRQLFDSLLKKAGMNSTQLLESGTPEYTHAAVAAYIAGGMADAGFGVEAAARRFGLEFIPMATERYFLAINNGRMKQMHLNAVCTVLQDEAFKHSLDQLPGYDSRDTGMTA
jgi:molybdate transport repressor ModE-like protein